MRIYAQLLILTTLTVNIQSCASTKDSVFLGVGIGSLIGAGIAAMMPVPNKNHTKSIGLGVGLGAALGGAAGYYESKKKKNSSITSPSSFLEKGEGLEENEALPSVTRPIVKKVWIPDRIEDNQFIKGHFVYVIERPSVWSTDDGKEEESENSKGRSSKVDGSIRKKNNPVDGAD